MTYDSAIKWFIHITSYGRGSIFVNLNDTEYVKKIDNVFHISPPISTYYTSNCLFFISFLFT